MVVIVGRAKSKGLNVNILNTPSCAAIIVTACVFHSPLLLAEEKHGSGHHKEPDNIRFSDAEKWAARFEKPARDAWQTPDKVIAVLKLNPNMIVADIGSATGYFPVRIAAQVTGGRVWGVDVAPGMVRYLNNRARQEKIPNLFSILGTFEDPLIPEKVDRILLVDTYHHIKERQQYFRNLATYLKPQGNITIVDFLKKKLPIGPPPSHKISKAEVMAEMKSAGFKLLESSTLKYQFVLVYAP